MKQAINLELVVELIVLRVIVINSGKQNLRLWARNNSWGWSMFSLLLALPGTDTWREMTPKPVRWTVNIPYSLDLPVKRRLDYEIPYQDSNWDGLDNINAWLNQPLRVKIKLRIIETPEAVAQKVFIGEAISSSCLSLPPHSWLTGKSS